MSLLYRFNPAWMSCVLFFSLIILPGHDSYAQSNAGPLLEKKLTLTVDKKSLGEVMGVLEKKAGFSFSYSSGIIDEKKVVSVRANNRPLREILTNLFAPAIRFKEKKGYIILSKVPENEKKMIVSGYVETADGRPIESATVYDNNSLVSANTNKYGYYELRIEKRHPVVLQVSKKDYFDTIPPLVQGTGALQNVVITPRSSVIRSLADSLKTGWDHVVQKLSTDSLFPVRDSLEIARRDSLRDIKLQAFNDSLNANWKRFKNLFLVDSVRAENVTDTIYRDIQFSFLPYISTNRRLGGNCINRFSFNALAGYSMGTDGFELGGLANINRHDMHGFQLAGFSNLVGQNIEGFQIGGFANVNQGSLHGIQIGGFANVVGDKVEGLQIGGFSNVVFGIVHGFQIGGFSNVNLKETHGLQFAGFSNLTLKSLHGMQISGFANIVTTEMKGIQIAGFLNYAREAKGIMIAPFNVADTLKGIPIGFLSFIRKGYNNLELSSNDLMDANIAFRSGVRGFYNILTAGMDVRNLNTPLWSFGYGIGTSPRLLKNLYLNADLTSNHISKGRFNTNLSLDNQLYLGLDWQIGRNIALSAGGVLHGYLSEYDEPVIDLFDGSMPDMIHDDIYGDTQLQMWIGLKVGVRFF